MSSPSYELVPQSNSRQDDHLPNSSEKNTIVSSGSNDNINQNNKSSNSTTNDSDAQLTKPLTQNEELPITTSTTSNENNKSETISISSKRFQDNEEGVDSEHAWVIDVACFFVQFFVIGSIFSFGVFLPVYIEAFNSDQSAVSWIGSIGSCMNVFLGIFTGAFDDRFGNHIIIFVGSLLIVIGYILASFSTELWHLYVTHGVIAGFGYSACFISSVSIVGQWFKRSRGLAVGVAVAGSGIGQFAMTQIIGALIAAVKWRQTLRYLALINGVGLIGCSLIIRRRLPCARHLFNFQNQKEFFSNLNFMLLSWAYMIFIVGMLIPNTYLLIYSKSHGISQSDAVFLLSVMGITNGVGRVVVGEIADWSFGRLNILKISMVCGGVCTFCWLACKDFDSILAFSLIYGFVGGGAVSLVPSIATDILGVKKISSFMGLLYTISSVANLLSTPFAGFLSDRYDSYEPAIILSASCQIAGVFLLVFMRMNLYIEASRKLRASQKSTDSANDCISENTPAPSSKPHIEMLKQHKHQPSTRKVIQEGDAEEEIVVDFSDLEEGKVHNNQEEGETQREVEETTTQEEESRKHLLTNEDNAVTNHDYEETDLHQGEGEQTSLSKV